MAANDGKDAEAAFEEHWLKIGHVERLRDARDLHGLNGRRVKDFAKPADFLVSARDHPLHYAEVKSTVDGKCFSFSKIQPGQSKAALLEASRGHGNYWFYIFSYPLGQWFLMSAEKYAYILDTGKKSVQFKDLQLWHK